MVIVRNPQLPTFQQVVLGYERVVNVEYIADLCALTDQCLYHLNGIVESYSGHVIRIVFYTRLNND